MAAVFNISEIPENLVRRYGFFKCQGCGRKWESSLVSFNKVTLEVPYGQKCKTCKIVCKPYHIERIKCRHCGLEDCRCTDKPKRHYDYRKRHRSDLCEKCKAGFHCESNIVYIEGDDDTDDYYNNAHSHLLGQKSMVFDDDEDDDDNEDDEDEEEEYEEEEEEDFFQDDDDDHQKRMMYF